MESNNKRQRFLAVVLGNTLAHSKDKHTPSVKIKCRCLHPVDDPSATSNSFTIYGDLWLTYKCAERTVKTLSEVFNWKGNYITDFNNPILVGKKCELVIEYEEYKGEMKPSILFFNRAGGMQQLEPDDLQKLVDDVQPVISDAIKSLRGDSPEDATEDATMPPSKSHESVSEGEVTSTDDDLPF